MDSFLDIVALAGSVLSVVLLLLLMKRFRGESSGDSERILRDELRAGRGESQEAARELREELGRGLKDGNDSLTKSLAETSKGCKVLSWRDSQRSWRISRSPIGAPSIESGKILSSESRNCGRGTRRSLRRCARR